MSTWTRRASVFVPNAFQWRVLGLSLGVTVLSVVFILYSNRLLAKIVCFLLRISTWDPNTQDSFWIEAESIHISVISGRIMLRDVKYHSSNQTLRAVKCFITWRYWLWRTRENSDIQPNRTEDQESVSSKNTSPCRILVRFEGVEWLMYNRTMVFDDILQKVQKMNQRTGTASPSPEARPTKRRARAQGDEFSINSAASHSAERYPPPALRIAWPKLDLPSKLWTSVMSLLPTFDFSDLLPIAIEVKRGAIMLGNASTPTIFTITFATGSGTYSVGPSRSRYDEYKQIYNLEFMGVLVRAEENPDFSQSLYESGSQIISQVKRREPLSPWGYKFGTFRRLTRGLSFSPSESNKSDRNEAPSTWKGLQSFLTEAEREQIRQQKEAEMKRLLEARRREVGPEYAKMRNILETSKLDVIYYADVAGLVPPNARSVKGTEAVDIGNGDVAPQWGVELVMHGGTITYGPWADRQRALLQKVLAPPSFFEHPPTQQLVAGDTRLCTEFRLFVEFPEEIDLRIPCREASKDWQFDKLPDLGQSRRQAAQLSCKISKNSSVNYIMPMVASKDGYETSLDVQLYRISVESSLNNKVFLEAEECRVRCKLPTPLIWNAPRQWIFNIGLQKPIVHLLRDHVTLLTDLGKDWSAGPPTKLELFIPMMYAVRIKIKDYALSFNVNDQNIVDSPTDPNYNALITLRGSSLTSSVDIPSLKYQPEANSIPFFIDSADLMTGSLTLPKWNTRTAHATRQITDVGRVLNLRVDGSFKYHSIVNSDLVDRLHLDIKGRTGTLKSFGWVIRHLMVLQANYFGSFTNFTLPTEALSKRANKGPLGDPIDAKYREGQSNVMEVTIELQLSDTTIALPEALLGYEIYEDSLTSSQYGIGSSAIIAVPEILLSFRLHDYGLEMTLNTHQITISTLSQCPEELLWDSARNRRQRKELLVIEELDIMAHRLFGPQPHTTTYFCIWEIEIGNVKGTMAPSDLRIIGTSVSSFLLNFKDELNAPAEEFMPKVEPDVTFLKLRIGPVYVTVETGITALVFSLPNGVQLSMNDMPTATYRKVTCISVPKARLQCLLRSSSYGTLWLEGAAMSFDIAADIYSCPEGWRNDAAIQRRFVREQDALTRRVPFVYENLNSPAPPYSYKGPILLPHPCPPRPFDSVNAEEKPSDRRKRLQNRQSFDSDDDRNPEVDIDQQLALSRPHSPLRAKIQLDESSGIDESDEASDDSLSSVSSDEDLNEAGPDDAFGWPELRHYSNVIRRFRLDGENKEQSSRFIATRDTRSNSLDVDSGSPVLSSIPSFPDELQDDEQGDGDFSLLRIISSTGLNIDISPITLHSIRDILPAVYENGRSIELELDALMAQFINMDNTPKTKSRIALEVAIPSIHLRSSQSILSSDDAEALRAPFADPKQAAGSLPVNSRIVSVLDILVEKPTAFGLLGSGTHPLTVGAHQAKVTLGTFDSHLLSRMNRNVTPIPSTVLSLTVADSTAVLGTSLQPRLGNVHMEFQSEAPAPVLASLELGMRVFNSIASTVSKWSELKIARSRYLMWAVLEATDKAQADPLSRAITSSLVQSGRPSELREDICWKVLNHTRQRLPKLQLKDKDRISKIANDRNRAVPIMLSSDMAIVFQKAWKDWTGDLDLTEGIESLPLFRILYPGKRSIVSSTKLPPISIRTGFFQFTLEDPNEEGSEIKIGPFNVDVLERRPVINVVPTDGSNLSLNRVVGASTGQTTFRHIGAVCDLGAAYINLSPALLPFAGRVYRARNRLRPPPRSPTSPTLSRMQTLIPAPRISPSTIVLDMTLHFHDLTLTSKASHFSFHLSLLHPTLVLNARFGSLATRPLLQLASDSGGTVSCAWEKFGLRVAESVESVTEVVLAEFAIETTSANAAWFTGTRDKTSARISLSVGRIYLSIPRHVARLLHSVQGWWQDYFRNQVNPLLNLIYIATSPRPSRKVSFKPQAELTLDIQANVALTEVHLHAVLGVWLVSKISNFGIAGLGNISDNWEQTRGVAVMKIDSQELALETWQDPDDPKSILPQFSFTFPFPPLQVSARFRDNLVRCRGTFALFEIILNANAIDALVRASRQLASSDLERLFAIFQQSQPSEPRKNRTRSPSLLPSAADKVDLRAQFLFSGFRLVLAGDSSLCFFDVKNVSGEASSPRNWNFSVSDVSFSLAPKMTASSNTFDRRYRLAYMVFDFSTTSSVDGEGTQVLNLKIDKVHAVMQATAMGVLGDLVDSYQAEVQRGRDELSRQRLMRRSRKRSISRKPEPLNPPPPVTSFLEKRRVTVSIHNIGAAIPLTLDHAGSFLPNEMTSEAKAERAFLISILHVDFNSHHGEAGEAHVQNFAFQFLEEFDQSFPGHFLSANHMCQNQMICPRMATEVRSNITDASIEWLVKANVSGFDLDINPEIVNFVFSLLDVYRTGLSRLEALATSVQASDLTGGISSKPPSRPLPLPRTSLNIRTTHLSAALEFQSGRVRLHHQKDMSSHRPRSLPEPPAAFNPAESEISANLLLPVVSLWMEWRATPASLKGSSTGSSTSLSGESPASLAFKSTIHSSKNTLRPSLLKFVSQITGKIENRLSRPLDVPSREVATTGEPTLNDSSQDVYSPKALDKMAIVFCLRIDRSSLELTCQPDVNVRGGLHWESGGFVFTATPGAKAISFIGSVENLSANLKHGYLSEECVEATASNLAFSAALSSSRNSEGVSVSRTSIVVETDLAVTALFARLQDILCFKAVWLDNIAPFTGPSASPVSPPGKNKDINDPQSTVSTRPWVIAVLVQVRRFQVEADLGPSISLVQLTLEPIVFRTLLTESLSELFFSVKEVNLSAKRAFSGEMHVPDFLFRTVRGRVGNYERIRGKESLLSIDLNSGPLRVLMLFEGSPVFLYDSQPLRISILDDWSKFKEEQSTERILQLQFSLLATGVNVVAVTSAPAVFVRLIQNVQTLLQAQYDGAARESASYRRGLVPRKQLADVATSMVSKTDQDPSVPQSWMAVQEMKVGLGLLRVGIAREGLQDSMPWGYLEAKTVEARLVRKVGGVEAVKTSNMLLGLGSIQITRLVSPTSEAVSSATVWLDRTRSEQREVLRVPTMQIEMTTREFLENALPVLAFDLHNEQGGSKEELSIGTDLNLFDWVREMYHLIVLRIEEVRIRKEPAERSDSSNTEDEDLTQSFSLEPAARSVAPSTRPQPFEKNGKQWRPEAVSLIPPIIRQLGRVSPGLEFYKLVTKIDLVQAVAVWVHELVTVPVDKLMAVLLALYTRQLQSEVHTLDDCDS